LPGLESLHPQVLIAVKSSRRQLRTPFHSPTASGSSHLGHYRQVSSERRERS